MQLIEAEHKKRAAKGETPHSGKLFDDTQWSEERFVLKINDIIRDKSKKYERNNVRIDVLVIYTAEPWLNKQGVEAWLKNSVIEIRSNIPTIF